jgi:hypothetical protein
VTARLGRRPLEVAGFVAAVCAVWLCCSGVLWCAYDFGAFIDGGAFQRDAAVHWVMHFGGVMTTLVAVVWVLCLIWPRTSKLKTAWFVCWETAAVLTFYAVVVVLRRETWTLQRGVNDWAMFFGSLNARFFSEAGILTFGLEVVPVIAITSALMFWAQLQLVRAR